MTLLAVLSALALTAITAPGVASAADAHTLTTMQCETDTPVAHSRMGCVVTVVPIFTEADGAPTGEVALEVDDPTTSAIFGPASCTLQDLGGGSNESACTFTYESRDVGFQAIWATYSGGPGFESSRNIYPMEVIQFGRPTLTEPVCDVVTLGSAGFCTVTVRGFFGATIGHPRGPVTLTASGPAELSSNSCELVPDEATINISRCQVRYAPLAFGPLTVTAEYHGDPRIHRYSNGAITVPVKGVFQVP